MARKLKAFYITGKNGSYLDIEDGRFADTVIGSFFTFTYTKTADAAMASLSDLDLEFIGRPTSAACSMQYLQQHVGA